MDKRNFGVDPKRNKMTSRENTNGLGRVYCTDGSTELPAGSESNFSPASLTSLLDDGGKRKNRLGAMLEPARKLRMGYLGI